MENKDYESQRREKNIIKDKKTLSLDFSAKEESEKSLEKFPVCKSCRYFYDSAGSWGECHRNAPSPLLYSPEDKEILKTLVLWPSVIEEEWCGEWKQVS